MKPGLSLGEVVAFLRSPMEARLTGRALASILMGSLALGVSLAVLVSFAAGFIVGNSTATEDYEAKLRWHYATVRYDSGGYSDGKLYKTDFSEDEYGNRIRSNSTEVSEGPQLRVVNLSRGISSSYVFTP